MEYASAMPAAAPAARRVWIQSPGWDLGWLIGSAAIVPLVLLVVWGGASSSMVNLGTTALIGGPHLFSTYTATYLDPRFRRSHRPMLWLISLAIPALVVWGTLANFQVLLSVFIFSASVHVLHQNAYLTDIYRKRAGTPEATWSRLVDYGLMMLCIYPIASWKLVRHDFLLGDIEILIPPILRAPITYWCVWIAFAVLLAAWLAKTWDESQRTPGAPAIFRAACRQAGFRAREGRVDYFDPTPDRVRWWPPEGRPVYGFLAHEWNAHPALIARALPQGQTLLLPAEIAR